LNLARFDFGGQNDLVWHTQRHEFCSRTAQHTGDPVVAQELARHKDLRTTQGYRHAPPCAPSRVLSRSIEADGPGTSSNGGMPPEAKLADTCETFRGHGLRTTEIRRPLR